MKIIITFISLTFSYEIPVHSNNHHIGQQVQTFTFDINCVTFCYCFIVTEKNTTGIILHKYSQRPIPGAKITGRLFQYESSSDGTFIMFIFDDYETTFSKEGYVSTTLLVSPGDTLKIDLIPCGKCYTKLLFNFVILSHSH